MDMLCDDITPLKTCSLTCKVMFASTRHLIRQRLRLPTCGKLRILARAEKHRPQGWNPPPPPILRRVLPYITKRGLLQYTRQTYISLSSYSSMNTILSHLHHLQSLDLNRVHNLSIEECYAPTLETHFKPSFIYSYPTVTSLTLTRGGFLCHRDPL